MPGLPKPLHDRLYLCSHLVNNVTARKVSYFMWIPNCNVEAWPSCLFNTDTWLRLPPRVFGSGRG